MNWFRKRNGAFKKLNYTELEVDGIIFNVARSSARSMHITCKEGGKLYAVCNYVTKQEDFIKFLREHVEWAKKAMKKMEEDANAIWNKEVTKEEKKELENKLDMYVKKYETLMNVKVNRWSIYKMSTRWGSCTCNEKAIRFSLSLAKCSDDFIEYVVVHEMAHIFVPSHSKRFWGIVETYIPNYKKIRKTFIKNDDN